MKRNFRYVLLSLLIVILVVCLPVMVGAEDTVWETEPNDWRSEANRIYHDTIYSGTLSGTIDLDDNIDVYKFVLQSSEKVAILATTSCKDFGFRLDDANGNRIDSMSDGFLSNGYYNYILEKTLSAGTYYISFLGTSYNDFLYVFQIDAPSASVSSHTHDCSYRYVVTKPTCANDGYTTYYCSCGESYNSDYVASIDHSSDQWIIDEPADCYYDGLRYKICDLCGEEFDREWIPSTHTKVKYAVTSIPTVNRTGVLKMTCYNCEESYEYDVTLGFNKINGKSVFIESNGNIACDKWVSDSAGKWYYVGADGELVTDAWKYTSSGWCYIGADGCTVKNQWVSNKGELYYIDGTGYMVVNKWVKDSKGWIYLDYNGLKAKNKWVLDSAGWCYVGADGYAVTNCWKQDSKGWCYLNANGSMTKNKWIYSGNKWYYLDATGYMTVNQWKKDSKGWVYVGAKGYMLTNAWVLDSVGWCYVGADGYAVTNCWKQDSKGWCYLNANGSMTKSKWIYSGNNWYYLNASGYMAVNTWKQDSKGWMYLGSNGAMVKNGWAKDNGKWYYFNANGYMLKNQWLYSGGKWYYLKSNGCMETNTWKQDSKGWMYLGADGAMVTNTYLDGGLIGADGYWDSSKSPYDIKYNTLVYEDSRVAIRFVQITKEAIQFSVKNKTNVEITIQADCIAINGRSTEDIIMSDEVAPYSTGIVKARCSIDGAYVAGTISGQLRIIDFNRSFQTYDATFSNVVVNSAVTDVKPSVNLPLVYSDDKVDIYYKTIKYKESLGTQVVSEVVFTVRNKTNIVITIQANEGLCGMPTKSPTGGGFWIMSDDVAPNSVGDVGASLSWDFITSLDEISGSLRIIDFNYSFNSYSAELTTIGLK